MKHIKLLLNELILQNPSMDKLQYELHYTVLYIAPAVNSDISTWKFYTKNLSFNTFTVQVC